MTSIVEIPAGHFSGQRATTDKPSGADTRSLEDLIRELQLAANGGAVQACNDVQDVAATADKTAFIAPADGEIVYVAGHPQTGAAAGESMNVDVTIGGVSCLTGAFTMDDASADAVVEGTLDPAAVAFSKGDKVEIGRTYVAGGGPAPMDYVAVTVGCRFSE